MSAKGSNLDYVDLDVEYRSVILKLPAHVRSLPVSVRNSFDVLAAERMQEFPDLGHCRSGHNARDAGGDHNGRKRHPTTKTLTTLVADHAYDDYGDTTTEQQPTISTSTTATTTTMAAQI